MPLFRAHSLALLLIACAGLCACAKDKKRDVVAGSLPVPADEATAQERAQIASTVKEIETLAGELARPQAFRSLPVVVTTESMAETKRAGACFMENGRGKFILVNREVFREEARMAAGRFQTTLFRVLLHEIGHCYLGRDHLETRISGQGRKLRFHRREPGKKAFDDLFSSDYNVSSMESQSLVMPLALKKYYVAELLGLFRAASLNDIAEYTGGENIGALDE